MKILVANVGSTSYKCRLIDMNSETDLAIGAVEKVGREDAILSFAKGTEKAGNPLRSLQPKKRAYLEAP